MSYYCLLFLVNLFSPKCWEWLGNTKFTHLWGSYISKDSWFCQVLPPPFSFPKCSFTSSFLFHRPAAFILFFHLCDIWSHLPFFHHCWASLSTTTAARLCPVSPILPLPLASFLCSCILQVSSSPHQGAPYSLFVPLITCLNFPFEGEGRAGAPGSPLLCSLLLQQPLLSP